MKMGMKTADLFALDTLSDELRPLLEVAYPWEVLAALDAFCDALIDHREGTVHPTAVLTGTVYLAEGAKVGPHAYIEGPVWLGEGAEVGHGAYLRPYAVLAPGAKVMHSSEVKRSLLLPGAKAAHFNYVGDSVVGSRVNLGAGVKLANFKTFGNAIRAGDQDTGLRKFGAAIGDDVFVGCNAVTSPGTIVGARTNVYNGAMLRGVIPADSVVKVRQTQEVVEKK